MPEELLTKPLFILLLGTAMVASGLAFSRDPVAVRMESSFTPLYE